MDTNNWRPKQGNEPNMDASEWRGQLQPESRQRIVNKIMDTLKRHLPVSGQEGLHELQKIAQRFEEKIFTAATSQYDYLRKISLKMLSMETKSQGTMTNNMPLNQGGPSNQPPDPGLVMQPQVHNPGPQHPISLPNQPQSRQQLLSQNIQNNIASQPNLPPASSLAQTPIQNVGQNSNMQNIPGQNSVGCTIGQNSHMQNMFAGSQRQMQGRQQVVPQQQQQQSQNLQQYLYQQQQLQQLLLKHKLQLQQQQQQQQQQQNLLQSNQLQSSQQSVLQTPSVMQQPSMMQTSSLSSIQHNQQSQNLQQYLYQHQQLQQLLLKHKLQLQQQQQQNLLQSNQLQSSQQSVLQTPSVMQQPSMMQTSSLSSIQHNQQSQNLQQYLYQQQQLQQLLLKHKLQQQQQQQNLLQSNQLQSSQQSVLQTPSVMQQPSMMQTSSLSSIQHNQQSQNLQQYLYQQQQQNLLQSNQLQSSQQSVLQTPSVMQQPSMMQTSSLSSIQHNQQSNNIQQSTQSMLQQHPQVISQQPQQQTSIIHQQQTPMTQQSILPPQQQQLMGAQTGEPSGGDWQEEVYQKIKILKENHLPELNEIYQKIATKFQQHDSPPNQPKSEQFVKLKLFKIMLEHIITFLQVSKSNIAPNFKEKLGPYEKQISNFINASRTSKAMSSLQPRQLPPPHMHSLSESQSQVTQVHSHENQMNTQLQTTNIQGSVATMQQNNMTSMQHNSLSGLSTTQQNMMNSMQTSTNLYSGQGNAMNSLQQVPMSSLQQNPVSAPQQTNVNSLSSQAGVNVIQPNLNPLQPGSSILQHQQLKQHQEEQMLQSQQFKQQYHQLTALEASDLESTATSSIKKPRIAANHALLEETKEVNQQLTDTIVDISDEEVDPTAAAAAEGAEGTIFKCSFSTVALSPSLKSQYASAQMSPIQPLRLIMPTNHPNCSPLLLDKFPVESRSEDPRGWFQAAMMLIRTTLKYGLCI